MTTDYPMRTAAEYVQAWRVSKAGRLIGLVYDQGIAITKLGEGCDIESLTIVRHVDNSREYLPGTLADHVKAYRTGQTNA